MRWRSRRAPKRYWSVQFSLRTLLTVATLTACAFGAYRTWRLSLIPVPLRRTADVVMIEVQRIGLPHDRRSLSSEAQRELLILMRESWPLDTDSRFTDSSYGPFLGAERYLLRVFRRSGSALDITTSDLAFWVGDDTTAYVFPEGSPEEIRRICEDAFQ
jgi:hypothetical protein